MSSQILKFEPRHEFEVLANQHHCDRSLRTASRWSQFVTMASAQLAGRNSLSDTVDNTSSQTDRLYHLVSAKVSRSNLSRINEEKPYALYQSLFASILSLCQGKGPCHDCSFKNLLYSLDDSSVDLCLSVFPCAEFRTSKDAIKLHVRLNHAGNLPEFVIVTEGKTLDVTIGRTLDFPKGSMVAIDRGYNDYGWYNQLTGKGIFFVPRLKSNARIRVVCRRPVLSENGLTSDQTIEFTGIQRAKNCPIKLRRIGYRDPESGTHHVFLANNFKLAAKTIADIYKAGWQEELLF